MDTISFSVVSFSAVGLFIGLLMLVLILIEERPARPVALAAFLLSLSLAMSAAAGLSVGVLMLLLQTLLGWA